MNKINKEWHMANKMPKNPTVDQRIQWHIEHAEKCLCRQMTPKLKQEVAEWKSRKIISDIIMK